MAIFYNPNRKKGLYYIPSGATGGSVSAPLSIEYSANAFCENGIDPTPTVSNNAGAGTFSSTMGLVFVSTTTGQVDLSASTTGATYLITYTDTNAATAQFSLTVNALDDATFAYSQSSYSPTDADPTPTVTLAGGTFSAGSGLVFVDSGSNTGSSTGQIDLSASTVASYTVTYTTAGTCPNTSTQTVGITSALAQVNNVYSMSFDGSSNVIISPEVDLGINSSVSIWTNFSSSPNFVILGNSLSTNYLLYADATNIYARINNVVKTFAHSMVLNQWYNIVLVRTGDSIEVFQNGNSLGVQTGYGTTFTTKISTIGSKPAGNFPFVGKIDELGLFNTALTLDQVSSIYNATEVVAGVSKTADLSQLTTPPLKWYRMGD